MGRRHVQMIQPAFAGLDRALLRMVALTLCAVAPARSQQPAAPAPAVANTDPVVSPDGRHIAFVSNRDGVATMYVMDVDGSHVRRVVTQRAASPQWSPDGRSIRFAGT